MMCLMCFVLFFRILAVCNAAVANTYFYYELLYRYFLAFFLLCDTAGASQSWPPLGRNPIDY